MRVTHRGGAHVARRIVALRSLLSGTLKRPVLQRPVQPARPQCDPPDGQSVGQEILVLSTTLQDYRFHGFGNGGTVSMRDNHVHIVGKSLLQEWSQDIPYSELRPNFISMRSRSPTYALAWFFSILFGCLGAWILFDSVTIGPVTARRVAAGIFLVAFSAWIAWRLIFHSVLDWIIFPTSVPGQTVSYSRQGPDGPRVDQFTDELQCRIRDAVTTSQ